MNHRISAFTFIVFLLGVPVSSAWGQPDLFAVAPSPTVSFLNDHSYDNTDVDGTSLKPEKKTDGSDDLEPVVNPSAPKDQALDGPLTTPKKDPGNSAQPLPTREPDINGL